MAYSPLKQLIDLELSYVLLSQQNRYYDTHHFYVKFILLVIGFITKYLEDRKYLLNCYFEL